jgi:hypothetical protein
MSAGTRKKSASRAQKITVAVISPKFAVEFKSEVIATAIPERGCKNNCVTVHYQ